MCKWGWIRAIRDSEHGTRDSGLVSDVQSGVGAIHELPLQGSDSDDGGRGMLNCE